MSSSIIPCNESNDAFNLIEADTDQAALTNHKERESSSESGNSSSSEYFLSRSQLEEITANPVDFLCQAHIFQTSPAYASTSPALQTISLEAVPAALRGFINRPHTTTTNIDHMAANLPLETRSSPARHSGQHRHNSISRNNKRPPLLTHSGVANDDKGLSSGGRGGGTEGSHINSIDRNTMSRILSSVMQAACEAISQRYPNFGHPAGSHLLAPPPPHLLHPSQFALPFHPSHSQLTSPAVEDSRSPVTPAVCSLGNSTLTDPQTQTDATHGTRRVLIPPSPMTTDHVASSNTGSGLSPWASLEEESGTLKLGCPTSDGNIYFTPSEVATILSALPPEQLESALERSILGSIHPHSHHASIADKHPASQSAIGPWSVISAPASNGMFDTMVSEVDSGGAPERTARSRSGSSVGGTQVSASSPSTHSISTAAMQRLSAAPVSVDQMEAPTSPNAATASSFNASTGASQQPSQAGVTPQHHQQPSPDPALPHHTNYGDTMLGTGFVSRKIQINIPAVVKKVPVQPKKHLVHSIPSSVGPHGIPAAHFSHHNFRQNSTPLLPPQYPAGGGPTPPPNQLHQQHQLQQHTNYSSIPPYYFNPHLHNLSGMGAQSLYHQQHHHLPLHAQLPSYPPPSAHLQHQQVVFWDVNAPPILRHPNPYLRYPVQVTVTPGGNPVEGMPPPPPKVDEVKYVMRVQTAEDAALKSAALRDRQARKKERRKQRKTDHNDAPPTTPSHGDVASGDDDESTTAAWIQLQFDPRESLSPEANASATMHPANPQHHPAASFPPPTPADPVSPESLKSRPPLHPQTDSLLLRNYDESSAKSGSMSGSTTSRNRGATFAQSSTSLLQLNPSGVASDGLPAHPILLSSHTQFMGGVAPLPGPQTGNAIAADTRSFSSSFGDMRHIGSSSIHPTTSTTTTINTTTTTATPSMSSQKRVSSDESQSGARTQKEGRGTSPTMVVAADTPTPRSDQRSLYSPGSGADVSGNSNPTNTLLDSSSNLTRGEGYIMVDQAVREAELREINKLRKREEYRQQRRKERHDQREAYRWEAASYHGAQLSQALQSQHRRSTSSSTPAASLSHTLGTSTTSNTPESNSTFVNYTPSGTCVSGVDPNHGSSQTSLIDYLSTLGSGAPATSTNGSTTRYTPSLRLILPQPESGFPLSGPVSFVTGGTYYGSTTNSSGQSASTPNSASQAQIAAAIASGSTSSPNQGNSHRNSASFLQGTPMSVFAPSGYATMSSSLHNASITNFRAQRSISTSLGLASSDLSGGVASVPSAAAANTTGLEPNEGFHHYYTEMLYRQMRDGSGTPSTMFLQPGALVNGGVSGAQQNSASPRPPPPKMTRPQSFVPLSMTLDALTTVDSEHCITSINSPSPHQQFHLYNQHHHQHFTPFIAAAGSVPPLHQQQLNNSQTGPNHSFTKSARPSIESSSSLPGFLPIGIHGSQSSMNTYAAAQSHARQPLHHHQDPHQLSRSDPPHPPTPFEQQPQPQMRAFHTTLSSDSERRVSASGDTIGTAAPFTPPSLGQSSREVLSQLIGRLPSDATAAQVLQSLLSSRRPSSSEVSESSVEPVSCTSTQRHSSQLQLNRAPERPN